MEKGDSSNFKIRFDRGFSVPGAFKLDHLRASIVIQGATIATIVHLESPSRSRLRGGRIGLAVVP